MRDNNYGIELPKTIWNTGSLIHVLALTGGGYQGLYTAHFLAKLEEDSGKPCREMFDVITGTSIGGILATALVAGVPAKNIVNTMERRGGEIFKQRRFIGGSLSRLWRSPHSQGALEDIIRDLMPRHVDRKIRDLPGALIIPAINAQNNEGPEVLFKSRVFDRKNPEVDEDNGHRVDATMLEIMLATSAAPTYFPEKEIDGSSYVDGGLMANSPDLAALGELKFHYADIDRIRMLSVSALNHPPVLQPRMKLARIWPLKKIDYPKSGILYWFKHRNLIEEVFYYQSRLSVDQAKIELGSRHIRIDTVISDEDRNAIGLDVVTDNATSILKTAAERAFTAFKLGKDEYGRDLVEDLYIQFITHSGLHVFSEEGYPLMKEES